MKGITEVLKCDHAIRITLGGAALDGDLEVPAGARGIVVFAHGSGSSRMSPRNRQVAAELRRGGFGTLLFDLLTAAEDQIDQQTRELRFNIPLLAERLVGVTDWVTADRETRDLPMAYFGASTGSAAALMAASQRTGAVRAVVSRGGRPDLAAAALPDVKAPTLLIVGGYDLQVLRLNEDACAHLACEKKLVIVPKATHLFAEPGTLEAAAAAAREWYEAHLK
jgi:putative phosphoribosyl transferase